VTMGTFFPALFFGLACCFFRVLYTIPVPLWPDSCSSIFQCLPYRSVFQFLFPCFRGACALSGPSGELQSKLVLLWFLPCLFFSFRWSPPVWVHFVGPFSYLGRHTHVLIFFSPPAAPLRQLSFPLQCAFALLVPLNPIRSLLITMIVMAIGLFVPQLRTTVFAVKLAFTASLRRSGLFFSPPPISVLHPTGPL